MCLHLSQFSLQMLEVILGTGDGIGCIVEALQLLIVGEEEMSHLCWRQTVDNVRVRLCISGHG